jgi:tetratricopeptide (TPR) repeat protein
MGKASARKRHGKEAHTGKAMPPGEATDRQRLPTAIPRIYVHLMIVAALGLLVYSNTLHVPFVFDGTGQIRDNQMIKNLDNFRLALEGHRFSSAEGYMYVPSRAVGYLSFALNYYFGGLDVVGYHITNLLIHIVSAALVYFLVLLTFNTPVMRTYETSRGRTAETSARTARILALFTALLFVSHPVQTEAVTYIVQRFASLAAMFYLLSVVAYITGRLASRGAGKLAGYLLALFFAVLAMRTKEIAFTLPIVIVMYDFLFFSTPLRKRLAFLAPVLLTLCIIPLTLIGTNKPLSQILSDVIEKTRLQTSISRTDYLLTQMRVVTTYVRLLFVPVHQNIDYDYPVSHSLLSPAVLLSMVFLMSLFGLAIYLLRRARTAGLRESPGGDARYPDAAALFRLAGFGILWFFVTLSVESSVIPIADVIFEHRLYLPSVGAFLAITSLGFALAGRLDLSERKKDKAIIVLCGAVVVVLAATAYARNAVWGTAMSLWQDAAVKSPDKVRVLNNLGREYLEKGRLNDAELLFKRAMARDPRYAEDYYDNMGNLNIKRNSLEAAKDAFVKELGVNPRSGTGYVGLCAVTFRQGRYDEALDACNRAIKIEPDIAYEAYNTLSSVYRKLGRAEEAAMAADQSIRLNPDFSPPYNNLGLLYASENNNDAAEAKFREAVRLDPGYTEAYSNLGGLYIVTRRPEAAVRVLEAGLKTDDARYPNLHFNLAVARYLTGDQRGAMEEYEVLRAIDPAQAEKLLATIGGKKG